MVMTGADLGAGGVDWVASHPPFGEAKQKKLKKVVNIMAD